MVNSTLMIFMIKGFRSIAFIFIVISTTFRPICAPVFFRCLLSKFLRRTLMIFIIKGFQIIAFIFIVISTTFRPICAPVFFRCLLSKFLRRTLMIFIIKGFRSIAFIFIVISTTFRPICAPVFFRCLLSKFLRRTLMIFIIKGFRTIVFIFIVISTTFRPICHPAFFRCLSNSETFTELRTSPFIESTVVACSDSISYNQKPLMIKIKKNKQLLSEFELRLSILFHMMITATLRAPTLYIYTCMQKTLNKLNEG